MNKKIIISIVLLMVIFTIGIFLFSSNKKEVNLSQKNTQTLNQINAQEFEDKYATGNFQVIDVRTLEEYSEGTITQDPLLIDFYDRDFKNQLDKLDKDQPYLIYCRSGNRSGQTLEIMKDLGFQEVYDLDGGENTWKTSGREFKTSVITFN